MLCRYVFERVKPKTWSTKCKHLYDTEVNVEGFSGEQKRKHTIFKTLPETLQKLEWRTGPYLFYNVPGYV